MTRYLLGKCLVDCDSLKLSNANQDSESNLKEIIDGWDWLRCCFLRRKNTKMQGGQSPHHKRFPTF